MLPGIAGSFINRQELEIFPDFLKTTVIADRKELLRSDAFRSLVFIILAAGTIYAFMQEKIRKEYMIIILGVLILFDLWGTGKRYLNADRFAKPAKSISPSIADNSILKEKSYTRVLNVAYGSTFSDNTPTSYFHNSIGCYHGSNMMIYQELIDSSLSPNIYLFAAAINNARSETELYTVFNSTTALNMLNTRYILWNPEAPAVINPKALGNAWFVEKPVIVNDANEEISRINNIDPASEALIDKRFGDQIRAAAYPPEKGDTIMFISYQPNELVYKSSSRTEKLAVFSEIYYPAGWKCFLDGKEADHFRANYVLRAMIVPSGEHEIRFVFEPSSYFTGNKVSLASSLLLFIIIAGYLIIELRKRTSR